MGFGSLFRKTLVLRLFCLAWVVVLVGQVNLYAAGIGWKAAGKNGAVAAGGEGAVAAGISILEQGGNAADAAAAISVCAGPPNATSER